MSAPAFRCGVVAVAGRPNVGKSTLVNALVRRKISIVTAKPQTTRQRVLGIRSNARAQIVFADTPGLHAENRQVINRHMNRAAMRALDEADLVLLVTEAPRWTAEDAHALSQCQRLHRPLAVAVNKIDKLRPRTRLLPYLEALQKRADFAFMVPVSAEQGENLAELENLLVSALPEAPPLYPLDQVTDQAEAARAAEFIREQLMQALAQEVPYAVAVQVEEFTREDKLLRVSATIWVEREGQKAIVIGHNGEMLKAVGREARLELQREFHCKVFLRLWAKVRAHWSDDEAALEAFGLKEP